MSELKDCTSEKVWIIIHENLWVVSGDFCVRCKATFNKRVKDKNCVAMVYNGKIRAYPGHKDLKLFLGFCQTFRRKVGAAYLYSHQVRTGIAKPSLDCFYSRTVIRNREYVRKFVEENRVKKALVKK